MDDIKLNSAWADYRATIDRLEEARDAHQEAFKASVDAYKRWLALGGKHTDEENYGKP